MTVNETETGTEIVRENADSSRSGNLCWESVIGEEGYLIGKIQQK